MESRTWLDRGRIPSLDGLRAIAIVLVLLAHAHQTNGFPRLKPLLWLGRVGHVGVEVFFVLSGFLITLLMLRETSRLGRLNLRAFYARRVLRIVPAYLCLLVAVAALQRAGIAHPRRCDWIGALTYTTNFVPRRNWDLGHCWSLSIEEHFYLIWPLLVTTMPAVWRAKAAASGVLLSLVSRLAILAAEPRLMTLADDWTFCRLDGIASGCLLAIWASRGVPLLDRIVSCRLAPLLAGLFLALSQTLASRSGKYGFGFAYTVNAGLIAVLVWTAACQRWAFLNWRPVTWVGVLSYSLYLWQQLFLNPNREVWWTRFPQNVVLALAAAAACYYLVESPLLYVKDRIGRKNRDEVGAVPTPL